MTSEPNTLVTLLLLSGILALIIVRTLRRDIARYNRDEELVSLTNHMHIHIPTVTYILTPTPMQG